MSAEGRRQVSARSDDRGRCPLDYLDFRFADVGWRQGCPRPKSWFADLPSRESFTHTAPA